MIYPTYFSLLLVAPLVVPVGADLPKGCSGKKPFNTAVEVNVDIPDTRYNLKLSSRKLAQGHGGVIEDWKSKHEDHVWASQDLGIQGLARGGMGIVSSARFVGVPYDRYGLYYCPFVQKIEINVHYNTQIFIASEHKKGSCSFNATLDHELGHHKINVEVVREVVARLKKDLPGMIAYVEKRYVKKTDMERGFLTLKEGLEEAVKLYSEHMYKEMSKRNDLLDSPQEYERVSRLCPDEGP